jgi:hypothetical protein
VREDKHEASSLKYSIYFTKSYSKLNNIYIYIYMYIYIYIYVYVYIISRLGARSPRSA